MPAQQDILWIFNFLSLWVVLFLVWQPVANVKCHAGIEPIRAHNSGMAVEIYRKGKILGDPNGCVVCHGGNPQEEKDPAAAHRGAPIGRKYSTTKETIG